MKFTLSWLKEYLDTSASLDEISTTLTNIGLEVEEIEDKSKELAPFTVAQIIEAIPHENSNKLKICQVQTAQHPQPLQIICGAANARTGLKVAYAPIGCVIPTNGMKIKKAKIAGVESNGMLCSAAELGLGQDSQGIIEIDNTQEIGAKITDIYGLDDVVIDINVTPNRGDCLGVYGIARDLAAAGIGTLKVPAVRKQSGDFSCPIQINNEAPDECQTASFRYIRNVKNCPSPKWLEDKLASIGMNSISAIVDITNYVMMALNRPMHAYDAKKIDGNITIRLGKADEPFTSLKNEEYQLDEKVLVIADDQKPVGIAGVIGGSNSTCELDTTDILLESAFFDPSTVAYGGRKLNILSDARYRFERGVDANSCIDGIDLASQLITEICGGEVSDITTVGQAAAAKTIDFDVNIIEKLTGIEIADDEAVRILSNLNFKVEKNTDNQLQVKVPSNRHDVSISQDLVEEIIRIHGYNEIQPQKLETSEILNSDNKIRQTSLALAAKGLTETINWSFCDENLIELFTEKNPDLIIANPISIEMNYMRPNLLVGLLESYRKNYLRGFVNLSLFEIGKIFLGTSETQQKLMVSGIRAGKNKEQDHYNDQRDFDIFDVKKDFFDVIELFGLRAESLQVSTADAPKYYHPHRFAALKLGKNLIGYFGEIHPNIAKKFDVKTRVNAFEIIVDNLPHTSKPTTRKSFQVNDLPISERDFAFLVDKDQAIGDIIKTIAGCDKKLIKDVAIFDIFTGKNIQDNQKSVALRIKIQPEDKTLTSEEIDIISDKIINQVTTKFNAVLRDG